MKDLHSTQCFDMDTLVARFLSGMIQVMESVDKAEEITRDWNTGL
jgi:hypothetical protein